MPSDMQPRPPHHRNPTDPWTTRKRPGERHQPVNADAPRTQPRTTRPLSDRLDSQNAGYLPAITELPPARQTPAFSSATPAPRHATRTEAYRRAVRVRATSAYALPVVPALILLYRRQPERFVRLHASRALVFFTLLAFGQVALFVALVVVGGALDAGLAVAAIAGLVFYVAFIALGILALMLWFLMLRDAMSGRFSTFPVLTRLAVDLESIISRVWARISERRGLRRNVSAS